jgi:hypothetical protein
MAQKKKPRKTKVRRSKTNRNLVLYVENCSLKGKVFSDAQALKTWVDQFNQKYKQGWDRDNWIDLIVTDIKGDITPVDPSMKVD